MAQLYTHGRWLVKDGREDEFIRLWQELADWTTGNVGGTGWAVLLQDEQDPRRFSSFGPWESLEAIEDWRSAPGFGERVGKIREVLESFEALTMRETGRVGTIG